MTFQEADNAETSEAQAESGSGVSALLCASRERLGEDLRDIARALHIRFIYLEAIEKGRFGDLPGTAYVIGFIRSYSDYLGLDSAEVVRRFKEEKQLESDNTQLVFPVPIPESSVPGGAIVLVGFMVAAVAYGMWYVGTAKDGFFAQMVTPVPERLADKAPPPQPESKPEVVETVAAPEPVAPEPVKETVVVLSEAEQELADVLHEAMAEKVVAEVVAIETAPADQQAAVSDRESFRILVKARQNSWIQVRDDIAQKLVVTKVLRAGDSYQVPNQPGLKLLTGNAGALDIYVDGEAVPAIGESGTIRRGVALDPDRLVQGEAVE